MFTQQVAKIYPLTGAGLNVRFPVYIAAVYAITLLQVLVDNAAAKKRPVLSRERWLEIAFKTMSDKCVSKFSLDSLIQTMPVTKGSFYSHFENRSDFLMALVQYWDRHDTRVVVEALEAIPDSASPKDKLWELMCQIHDPGLGTRELLVRSVTMQS
jgi:AcrR family transcriptional regulator